MSRYYHHCLCHGEMSILTRGASSESPTPDQLDHPSTSLLYSILPTRIQDRMSRFPSIRGSTTSSAYVRKSRSPAQGNSDCAGHASSQESLSRPSTCCSSASNSGSVTPPPAYAAGSALARADGVSDCATSFPFDVSSSAIQKAWRPTHRPSFSTTSLSTISPPTETQTGILWRFASQGQSLLGLSVSESSDDSSSSTNPALSRQLYIHALTYLLRGLPASLTPEEQFSVRASLPPSVSQPVHLVVTQNNQHLHIEAPAIPRELPPHPSLLHRLLAAFILWLFGMLQTLLPYLRTFLSSAWEYERQHHVSEKALARGLTVVDGMGRGGLEFWTRVGRIGDGRVGVWGGQMIRWWIEGVAGGVGEGVGQGLGLFGVGKRRDEVRH